MKAGDVLAEGTGGLEFKRQAGVNGPCEGRSRGLSEDFTTGHFLPSEASGRLGNAEMLIQEMLQQVQVELEQAQVTAAGAVYDLDAAVPLGNDAQIDDPEIGQAGCDNQAGQACGVRYVAFGQVEPSALLIGEEGFNANALGVPVTRFFDQFHTCDQVDWPSVPGPHPAMPNTPSAPGGTGWPQRSIWGHPPSDCECAQGPSL